MLLDQADRVIIKKRLKEIDKKTRISRTEKKKLLEELSKILLDLQYKRKYISFAYDSNDYYGLKDLEYTFGDLDDYYILATVRFIGNYQMYICRGDKDRDMDIDMYLDEVTPYLIALIDQKKYLIKRYNSI